MIQLKAGGWPRIRSHPPLISRIPPGVEAADLESGEIYKLKREFYPEEAFKGYPAAIGELYLSTDSREIFRLPLEELESLEEIFVRLFPEEKCRLTETTVRIHPADQVLSAGLGCPVFHPLLEVEQRIAGHGKLVGLSRVYLNPEAGMLCFPSAPRLI